jgi:hypothetical protein
MTADHDAAVGTGAVVRNPPVEETAMGEWDRCRKLYGDLDETALAAVGREAGQRDRLMGRVGITRGW